MTPMRLSDVRSEQRSLVVSFDYGDLKLAYRPNAYTTETAQKMQLAMNDPDNQADAFLDMVMSMLVSWDLEGDDGKVFPLEREAVRKDVPLSLFAKIVGAVQEDQTPGEAPKR